MGGKDGGRETHVPKNKKGECVATRSSGSKRKKRSLLGKKGRSVKGVWPSRSGGKDAGKLQNEWGGGRNFQAFRLLRAPKI